MVKNLPNAAFEDSLELHKNVIELAEIVFCRATRFVHVVKLDYLNVYMLLEVKNTKEMGNNESSPEN